MKKDTETQEKFMELRAQGWTFQRIAEELGVSKQTLINWSKDLKEELETRRALELEALAERYWLTREKRLELYGKRLEAVNEELERRIEKGDLKSKAQFSTAKLFALMVQLHGLMEKEHSEVRVLSEKEQESNRSYREMMESLPYLPV